MIGAGFPQILRKPAPILGLRSMVRHPRTGLVLTRPMWFL